MKTKLHKQPNNSILVVTRASGVARSPRQSGDRSLGDVVKRASKNAVKYVKIDPEVLQEHLTQLLSSVGGVLQNLESKVGEFNMESIELSVEITASGSVGLLGTGGEVGGTGGLTFTFSRIEPSARQEP